MMFNLFARKPKEPMPARGHRVSTSEGPLPYIMALNGLLGLLQSRRKESATVTLRLVRKVHDGRLDKFAEIEWQGKTYTRRVREAESWPRVIWQLHEEIDV